MSAEINSALSSIAIVLGGLAGGLVIIDWTLPNNGREWVKDKASTAWIWLEYQRTWPYVRKLQNSKSFDALVLIVGTFMMIYAFFFTPMVRNFSAPVGLWAIYFGLMVVPLALYFFTRRYFHIVFSWMTRGDAAWVFLLRGVILFLGMTAAYAAVLLIMLGAIYPFSAQTLEFLSPSWLITFLIFGIGWVFALTLFLLLIVLDLIIIYILAVYLVMFAFKVVQFIILRLIEYEKGPVLALAGLLTACGSIMKAISG